MPTRLSTRPRASSPEGFYGWRTVAISAVLLTLTAPGQTAAISAFVDPMISDLDTSRSAISLAYMVGTLIGALTLPTAGRLFDRLGARLTVAIIGAMFGTVLIGLAFTRGPTELTVGFAGVRMLGQGALGLCATTMTAVWFTRNRGTALGLVSAVGAAGISLAPLLLTPLISEQGWRTAWAVEGILVWVVVVPLAWWGIKDHPSDLGQQPDGDHRTTGSPSTPVTWGLSRSEAVRTPFFWLIAAAVATSGALSTAIAFHQISLLGERGLSTAEAAANFLPQMAAGLAATLLTGMLIDRINPRWATFVSMISMTIGLLIGTVVSSGWSAIAFGIVIGFAGGSIRTLEAATFPLYFGTAHLGSIRGIVAAISVGSTAVGPVTFATVYDHAGSYAPALIGSAAIPAVVAVFALIVAPPVTERAVPTL